MNKIIAFKIEEDYKIWMQFQDGASKIVDFKPLIGKGISTLLLEKNYFHMVSIDNGGGLEGPNGMDFCPNFLREYTLNSELTT
jgi:hypothetical protein